MSNLLYDRLFGCHAGETKPFLIFADGSDQSYDGFLRQTARFANVITDLGLVVGDRLAAQVEKSAAALALYAACVQSGVIFLPLNTAYTPAEVSYFVGDSGAKLVVADAGFDLAAVAAVLPTAPQPPMKPLPPSNVAPMTWPPFFIRPVQPVGPKARC